MTGATGFEAKIPYYFRLANNRDMHDYPAYLQQRAADDARRTIARC